MASFLINIDNGGTLTDFCAVDGSRIHRTKSLTTPHDLSKCLFEGLLRLSRQIYGEEDLQRLILDTDHIRYSTTQGTNALVERNGPRVGLLLLGMNAQAMRVAADPSNLFDALVGERVAQLIPHDDDVAFGAAATRAVNDLAAAGASRLVIGAGGSVGASVEHRLRKILLQRFPPHLLGALPILYSHQLAADDNDARRIWTALLNAFLHPAMERFLYNTEQRLRDVKVRKPLLIFRNDGGASRIARTAAIKTYSSGPRGGVEASRVLARHYDFSRLVGIDVGGTTTDISVIEDDQVRESLFGSIEGIRTSLALAAIESVGIGGSSIIRTNGQSLTVGPQSVGGVPGPACFGLGGTQVTITDAFLAAGLLDANQFAAGDIPLDLARAQQAIDRNIATPLGLSREAAILEAEAEWVKRVASAVCARVEIDARTTLAAFGGAGPLVTCRIAEVLGLHRVLVPGLAALLSAFGVGFSDISHDVDVVMESDAPDRLARARASARATLERAMFGEGVRLAECAIEEWWVTATGLRAVEAAGAPADATALRMCARLKLPRAAIQGRFGVPRREARSAGTRRVMDRDGWSEYPVVKILEQRDGAAGAGPAVLEDDYFTCRVDRGWHYEIDPSGDTLLTRRAI